MGEEMSRFKRGELHSGKSGKVVTDPKQAKAIALSACGQSKYSESLQSMGFSPDAAEQVTKMFSELDWEKQFETGKTSGRIDNQKLGGYGKGLSELDIDSRSGKQPGNQGKQKTESEMISPVAYPKGNPQQGPRTRQVSGLRMI